MVALLETPVPVDAVITPRRVYCAGIPWNPADLTEAVEWVQEFDGPMEIAKEERAAGEPGEPEEFLLCGHFSDGRGEARASISVAIARESWDYRDHTPKELRDIILALAGTGREFWVEDRTVLERIFARTKVRLRNIRNATAARASAPPGPALESLGQFGTRIGPMARKRANVEARLQSILDWRSARGHRIDREALHDELRRAEKARAEGIEATGVDLTDSTRPEPVFRWLDKHGIAITDERGKRKLSNDYWETAVVPEESQEAFELFMDTRNAASSRAKLTEIRDAMDSRSRVHTTFDVQGSVTGRMTSTGPALLNIAKGLRHIFVSDPGKVLVSLDLHHCEPAVMAMLSRDPALTEAVRSDPYEQLAKVIWGENAEGDKQLRGRAKPILLADAYGRGIPSLARVVGVTEDEARELQYTMRKTYPDLASWSQKLVADAKAGRPLFTITGRQLPPPPFAYQAVSHVVQGSAAEIFKGMVLQTLAKLPKGDSLWLPVHDELIVEVEEEMRLSAKQKLSSNMRFEKNGVRLAGEPRILGASWA